MAEPTDRTLSKLWASITEQQDQDRAEETLRRYAEAEWAWTVSFGQPDAVQVVARLDAYRRLLEALAATEEWATEQGPVGETLPPAGPVPARQLAQDVLDLLRAKDALATTDALWDLHVAARAGQPLNADATVLVLGLLENVTELVEAQLGDAAGLGSPAEGSAGEPVPPADPGPVSRGTAGAWPVDCTLHGGAS